MRRFIKADSGKFGSENQVKFFYKGKFLGSCDSDYIECPELLNLMESDKEVATSILNYMNSLGDSVFPVSEEDWGTPETNVDNVDITDLYNTFMQELDYEYRDSETMGFGFCVGGDYLLPDFEIFDGPTVDDVESSTKIKASRYDNVPGYKAPEGGYLYIFKHGIGPGTLPKDVEIIKTKDLPNGYTAVWLSDFLTTDELKKYDIPSETRINELLDRIGYCQKNGDVVPCDDVEACGDIKASTNDSSIVDKIYSVMMNYEYGYDPDMTDINAMLQELTNKGVHVDTSDAFKRAWVSAHNKAERKTWGGSGDSYHYDSLTPRELEAIENYDTEYWEYVKDHPFNLKPASITSSTDINESLGLEPRQRTAVDGKTWWVVYDTVTHKYLDTIMYFGKYKTKKECQYAIDSAIDRYGDDLNRTIRNHRKYFSTSGADNKVTGSTKYMANMVSASSFDSAYDENDELYKFHVAGYLHQNFAGLMEDWYTNDFEEALEHASEMGGQGLFVVIENQVDGRSRRLTPEEWEDAAEYGEYPDHIREDLAL